MAEKEIENQLIFTSVTIKTTLQIKSATWDTSGVTGGPTDDSFGG